MSERSGSVREAAELLRKTWSVEPAVIASAPGRVNLIGEHTDYNDGFVMPMAIDRRTAVAVAPWHGPGLSFASTRQPKPVTVGESFRSPQPGNLWANYPLGVLAQIEKRGPSAESLAFGVAGDVPVGAGLSSSAALEAATATALSAYFDFPISKPDMAALCQNAEHEFAGVRCGIMDQMASVLGHVIVLDCRTYEAEEVAIPPDIRVFILDSGIPRGLTGSRYNERRRQCEQGVDILRSRWRTLRALRDVTPEMLEEGKELLSDVVYRRCRHVVTENERVLAAREALRGGDGERMGQLLGASHVSMRDDYEISLPAIDRLVEIAASAVGCYGARLTGAGFGGAVVALVDAEHAASFPGIVMNDYRAETGNPGRALLASPDDGARVEYRA